MKINQIIAYLLILIFSCTVTIAQNGREMQEDPLSESITFFASFDQGFQAAYSEGDPHLFTSPSWEARIEKSQHYNGVGELAIEENAGRYGDALWIDNRSEPVYYYQGLKNIAYSENNWEGTVSFWLRLSPNEDLQEGYSDPIQLTDSAWNDGALYVDFTTKSPRTFRFAFFAEHEIWDPERREWSEIPVNERPMVEVEDQIFTREQWVHIAFSFRNFNTGKSNGEVSCFINGEHIDDLRGWEQTLIWDIKSAAIWLGYNYTGFIDEIALFDRALNVDEIQQIYQLPGGVGDLLVDPTH